MTSSRPQAEVVVTNHSVIGETSAWVLIDIPHSIRGETHSGDRNRWLASH